MLTAVLVSVHKFLRQHLFSVFHFFVVTHSQPAALSLTMLTRAPRSVTFSAPATRLFVTMALPEPCASRHCPPLWLLWNSQPRTIRLPGPRLEIAAGARVAFGCASHVLKMQSSKPTLDVFVPFNVAMAAPGPPVGHTPRAAAAAAAAAAKQL
jgi:hypothetical protein